MTTTQAPAKKKPLITANMVTITRMVLLPLPCALLLYGGEQAGWWALALFTFLGITDFIDGQMARHYGPTVLGGLLDPVADKVFMAAVIMPFIAMKLVHPYVAIAILFREFIITSLRSVMSLRGRDVKTSVLGKLKTAIQMVVAGFVFIIYRTDEKVALVILGVLSVLAVGVMVWRYVVTKEFRPLVMVPGGLILLALVVRSTMDVDDAVWTHWAVVLVFTWGSALDYLGGASVLLQSGGRIHSAGRLVWSVAAGIVLPLVMTTFPEVTPVWVLLLGSELTSGAVDNLRCHEKQPPRAWIYFARGAVLLAGAFVVGSLPRSEALVDPAFIAALVLALIMSAWTCADFIAARHIIWGEDAVNPQDAKQSVSR